MGNKCRNYIFYFILFTFLCVACKSNLLPNVTEPTYSIYSFGEERGYKVRFTLPDYAAQPTAVIINKIKQPVTADTKAGNTYKLNVISQSHRIFGFKPEIVNSENGIYFKTKDGETFKPVKFKLVGK